MHISEKDLLQGEMTSKEVVNKLFDELDGELLDRNQQNIVLDFEKVIFISVYFLERLENLVHKAKELNVRVQINNIQPSVYKVFQVARVKNILEVCN